MDTPSPSPGATLSSRLRPTVVGRYTRTLAWTTLVVQVLIVGTGGAVRLTGSGLGCPTWPRCTAGSFVATPEMGVHGLIEFGNRLLTFVLVAVAVLTFLAVLRTRGTGSGLFAPALAIGLGIPAQGVVGGVTVLTNLNPYVVGFHFVVSMVLVALSTVLVWRIYHSPAERVRGGSALLRGTGWTVAGLAAVTILVGIVTTGSGPHAGDQGAARNGLDPQLLQHLHSYPAYSLFACTLLLLLLARRARSAAVLRYGVLLLAVEGAQIAVGVTQARLGLPEVLVGLHMLLACLVAAAITAVVLAETVPVQAVSTEAAGRFPLRETAASGS